MTLSTALESGLIDATLNLDRFNDVLSSSSLQSLRPVIDAGTRGVRDSRSGLELSVLEAVQRGILDVNTLEMTDLLTNQRMPLSKAVEAGLIRPETAARLIEALNAESSLASYISRGQIDPKQAK